MINILVDGISFIEKLSFNAFNEGTRLIHCLKMHKRLLGVEAKKVGGDTGVSSNFVSADFRKMRTDSFQKSRTTRFRKIRVVR